MKKYIIKVWCTESIIIFEYFNEETWIKYFTAFKKEYPNSKIERYTIHSIEKINQHYERI